MNLIQIKQIDGLQDTLNSLAASVYDLDQDFQADLDSYNNFWSQLYWDTSHIQINSAGTSVEGSDNIALNVSNGGLKVYSESFFDGGINTSSVSSGGNISGQSLSAGTSIECNGDINIEGDLNATSSVGQIKFLSEGGNVKELKNIFQPSYSGVTSAAVTLSENNYIVGVKTSTIGAHSSLVLPVPTSSAQLVVKDEQNSAASYNINISPPVAVNIDGSEFAVSITGNNGYASFYSDGTDWYSYNTSGV